MELLRSLHFRLFCICIVMIWSIGNGLVQGQYYFGHCLGPLGRIGLPTQRECYADIKDECSPYNEALFLGEEARIPLRGYFCDGVTGCDTPGIPPGQMPDDDQIVFPDPEMHITDFNEEDTEDTPEQKNFNTRSSFLLRNFVSKAGTLKIVIPVPRVDFYEKDTLGIIRSCDPRAMSYCATTVNNKDGDLEHKCSCHPLYAENKFKDSKPPANEQPCKARPSVPCYYGVVQAETGRPTGPYYFGLHTNTGGTSATDPSIDKTLECIDNASCQPLTGTEVREFREGNIWHGFGFSPIFSNAMIDAATKICKCNPGFIQTKMLDCVSIK